MLKHKRLFQALWTGFEKLTQAVHDRNGHISIEWPRGCKYWMLTKVKTLLHRYDFVNATFDGCMLDLMSIVRTDMRIKKPWRISTTSRSIHSAFDNKLCDQSHEHVPCAGKDTKVTEEYTFKFVKLLHDAWRKHAHQISKRCHTSTHSSASPKIAFMIKKQFPSDQAKAKALELSSCCVCPSAMALSKYSSSSSASKAVNVGETPTESKFSDIRLAFTILEGERKTWIQFCQSLVANAMLVGEDIDDLPDIRAVSAKNASGFAGAHAGKCLKAIGSPVTELYTGHIINCYAPEIPHDKQWPSVAIYGDSGLCQYFPPEGNAKPKQDNSEVKAAIHYSFREMVPESRISFDPRHGCGLKTFCEWSRKALDQQDKVHIFALFLNDFVNPDGSIRKQEVLKALDEDSLFMRFLKDLQKLHLKILVIGGSAKVWNVDEDYDDLVNLLVAKARECNIPTVTGAKCWLQMPLIKEAVKGGKLMTWHLKYSEYYANVLSEYLKALYLTALYFNEPANWWLTDFRRNARQRTDPSSANAFSGGGGKKPPTPFGMNAVLIPRKDVPKGSAGSSIPEPAAPPPPREVTLQPRSVVVETPKIKGGDWEDKTILQDDVRRKYPDLENWGMPTKVEEGFSRTMCWLLRRGLAEKDYPSATIAGSAGWYEVETLRQHVENNRKEGFSIKDLLYVVANSRGKRFILHCQGKDPTLGLSATKVFIKCATGQHVLLTDKGKFCGAEELFAESDEMVPELHLPTGYAYHGTHLSLYKSILKWGLKPGGDGRSNRLMNHLSPYPPGDHRQIAGMREAAECYIIYDLARFQRDLKAEDPKAKVFAASNGVLNTEEVITEDYAVRVVHRRSGNAMWYNEELEHQKKQSSTRVPTTPPNPPPSYKRPPYAILMKMTAQELEEYNAQFPDYFQADEEAKARASKASAGLYEPPVKRVAKAGSASARSSKDPIPISDEEEEEVFGARIRRTSRGTKVPLVVETRPKRKASRSPLRR